MDNDENIIGEDTDADLDDIVDDTTDDEEDDSDDEFEYDEEGNIIIPDIEDFEEEEDTGVNEEGETDTNGENEDSSDGEGVTKPEGSDKDDKDARIAQLEAELVKFRNQGKETLLKLGVKSDDVMEGLISLAAEADGITPQEYLQNKNNEERDAQARALLQQQEFEKVATADLAELHAAYPETKQYGHIRDLPDDIKKKFGRFRDAGLSAKEAYAAANPDGIRNNVATAVKKKSLHDSKSHIHSTVPVSSRDNGIVMPKSELVRWRDLFPDKTDKEIISLYKNTAK